MYSKIAKTSSFGDFVHIQKSNIFTSGFSWTSWSLSAQKPSYLLS